MKRRIRIGVPFILFMVVLYACSPGNKRSEQYSSGIPVIKIYDPIHQLKDSISFFASQMRFVKLQFTNQCPIPEHIIDIRMTDHFIFVATLHALFEFDRTGQFIRRIGRLGRGPGEYLQINSMDIDTAQNCLDVFSSKGVTKIIQYDFSGNFIRDIRFRNNDYVAFDLLGDDYVFYPMSFEKFRDDYRKLVIIDTTGNITHSFRSSLFPAIMKEHGKVIGFGPTRDWSWKYHHQLYYLENGNDTICQIENNLLKQRYVLAGKNKLLPQKLYFSRYEDLGDNAIQLRDFDMIPANSCIYESDRFLFIRCNSRRKSYFSIYDKHGKQVYRSNDKGKETDCFVDDLLTGLPFDPVYRVADNQLAAVYYPFQLIKQEAIIERFGAQHHDYKTQKFLEMYHQLKESDNPVLLIARMK